MKTPDEYAAMAEERLGPSRSRNVSVNDRDVMRGVGYALLAMVATMQPSVMLLPEGPPAPPDVKGVVPPLPWPPPGGHNRPDQGGMAPHTYDDPRLED